MRAVRSTPRRPRIGPRRLCLHPDPIRRHRGEPLGRVGEHDPSAVQHEDHVRFGRFVGQVGRHDGGLVAPSRREQRPHALAFIGGRAPQPVRRARGTSDGRRSLAQGQAAVSCRPTATSWCRPPDPPAARARARRTRGAGVAARPDAPCRRRDGDSRQDPRHRHGRVTGDSHAGSVTIGRTAANTTIVLVNSSCRPLMAVNAQDVFAVNHQARDYSLHEIPSVARIPSYA